MNKILKELVRVELTKNQKLALESFITDRGEEIFKNSNLLKVINRGDFDAVHGVGAGVLGDLRGGDAEIGAELLVVGGGAVGLDVGGVVERAFKPAHAAEAGGLLHVCFDCVGALLKVGNLREQHAELVNEIGRAHV